MAVAKREIDRTPFGQRLFDSRERLRPKVTQTMAAKTVGMQQNTLSELEHIGTGSSYTAALARRYGCDAHWLETGDGDPGYHQLAAETGLDVTQGQRPPRVRQVWVVGKTQGGMPERIWSDGDQPVGSTDQYAELATSDEHAFLCRVVGHSMSPRFFEGDYVLVEPDASIDLEDDVLVRLASGETILKRLLSRRGGIRLGSYNAAEVMTFSPEEITWMYYVAHSIPAKRITARLGSDFRDAPTTGYGDLPPNE